MPEGVDSAQPKIEQKPPVVTEQQPKNRATERISGLITKIKSKISGPQPDPDSALKDIAGIDLQSQQSIVETVTAVSQPEESHATGSKAEYQKVLDEVRRDKIYDPNGFQTLKRRVEQEQKAKPPKEVRQREFTDEDRARHERLLALAQSKKYPLSAGLRSPEEFIKLVELIETQVAWTDYERQEFDHQPTEEEQVIATQVWKEKGYGSVNVYQDREAKWILSVQKPLLYNIGEGKIPLLRDLANTTKDPADALRILDERRIYSLHDIRESSKAPKDLVGFLASPHSSDVIQALKIDQFDIRSDQRAGYLDKLTQIAKSPEVASLTPDLLDKVNVIALATQRKIYIDDLLSYVRIVADEGSFNFLIAALDRSSGSVYGDNAIFDNIAILQRDNLLRPIGALAKLGIDIPFHQDITRKIDEGSEWYQKLRSFAQSPEVAQFLEDKDAQDFARIAEKLTGKKSTLETISGALGRKEDIAAFLQAITTEEDKKDLKEKGSSLAEVNNFLSDDERSKIFFDQDFQEYIVNLQKDIGIVFNAQDYTKQYFRNPDSWANKDPEYLFVELFKMHRTLEFFQNEDVAEIIKGIHSNSYSDEHRKALRELERYRRIDTFVFSEDKSRLVENMGLSSQLNIDSLTDTDFMVLLTVQSFSKDLKDFIKAEDSTFPHISPDALSRYRKLDDIFGFSKIDENFARDVLRHPGQIMDHGKPTKAFIDLMISHKYIGGIFSNLLTSDIINQYEGDEKSVLLSWKSLPDNLKVEVTRESSDFSFSKTDLDFLHQIYSIAGENSLAILNDYRRYAVDGITVPEDRSFILDYAHVFKDPQLLRDPVLRKGYKMMGSYLTLDSYRLLKGIINGSVEDEVLRSIGITQKGEEGIAQLESTMHNFILGLGSGNAELSLLDHKIFSDFLKSYVRYEVSQWGVHDIGNFNKIIQTLQRIKESKPEVLVSDLPSSGIQEIAKIERSETNETTFTHSFLSRYSTFTNNIQIALDAINQPRAFSSIARNMKTKIDEQVVMLEEDLEKNIDKLQAQAHIQKRIEKLKTVDPGDVRSFQANFAALAQEKVFSDILMQSVFAYTLQKFPEQRERMAQAVSKESPDVDSISAILDFTEHMTTKEAWKSYFSDKNAKRAFQNILDTKEINDGLSRLMEEGGKSRDYTPVEFVPTRGILMEFSGYIADACWASKYESSAEQFPNITAVMMQDVSKDVPKLLGSSLLIETTSTDGTPLLIIRGLNPLESYINHVDIPDFYSKFTDYVKRVAESGGRKGAIVIDNHSGGSSTNRPLLFNYLTDKKAELASIAVPSEDTTFNGYDISHDTYLLN